MARGPHQKLAILWLRLIGTILTLYGVTDGIFGLMDSTAETSHRFLQAATWYIVAGIVLWLFSPPIGGLVATGLDGPADQPPVA